MALYISIPGLHEQPSQFHNSRGALSILNKCKYCMHNFNSLLIFISKLVTLIFKSDNYTWSGSYLWAEHVGNMRKDSTEGLNSWK